MRQFRVLPLVMLTASLVACGGGGGGAGQGGAANTGPQGSIHNGGGSTPTLGTPCKTAGEQTGIPNGTAICKADASGALHWESYNPNNPNGGGSNTGGSNPSGSAPQSNNLRLGDACQTDGTFGYGDGMITICDKGKARYAVPTDVPAAPAGGYTKRPDWYPTLAEIFSPKVDECPNGKVTFGAPFLPLEHLTRTVPAGAMIAGHVTPIDHMYVGIDTLDREPSTLTDADYLPITAPADGWLIDVGSLGSPTSHRVVIVHGCGIVSVYMVINKLTGVLASVADSIDHGGRLEAPVPIKMGDEFGRSQGGHDNPYDIDGPLTRVDWSAASEWRELTEFVTQLVALRHRHSLAAFRFHGVGPNIDEGFYSRSIAWNVGDLYVMVNAWWEPLEFDVQAMPRL